MPFGRGNRTFRLEPLTVDEIAEIAPLPLKFRGGLLVIDAEIGDQMYPAGADGSFTAQCVHFGEPKIVERWREEYWATHPSERRRRQQEQAEERCRKANATKKRKAAERSRKRKAAKRRKRVGAEWSPEAAERRAAAKTDNWYPKYWMYEKSGILAPVIERCMKAESRAALTPGEIEIMRAYCVIWIDADCWDWNLVRYASSGGRENLASLRSTAREIDTPQSLENWLKAAAGMGMNPL